MNIFWRWFHVIAGFIWLGHLYFFNLVNVPFQASLSDAEKVLVNAKLLPRVLWWFRWGAMFTVLAGLALFTAIYMYVPGEGFGPSSLFVGAQGMTDRAVWILFGMALAGVMWFNVWMVIWPAQKKMLRGRASEEELPRLRRRVYLASRTNAYLSAPMLFAMLAPAHFGAINFKTWLSACVGGFVFIWLLLKISTSVGSKV
jgi:uncharacterized membrane protein